MWQASEWIFIAVLQRRQENDRNEQKTQRTIALCTCFAVTIRGTKPNNGCLVIVPGFKLSVSVTRRKRDTDGPEVTVFT
jgi:hypothetical protein